ncbi:MAG: hypothetical protein ACFCUN_02635 [Hyphomicrobiaceae bacterium]
MMVAGLGDTAGSTRRAKRASQRAVVTPVMLLAFAVFIAILPWGLPSGARYVMPMLPYAVIHYFTTNARGLMPSWLIFLAGLTIDVATQGPLGLWPLVFLTGKLLAINLSGSLGATSFKRVLGYAVTLVLLAGLQWGATSLYFLEPVDGMPFFEASMVLVFAYPLVALFGRDRSRSESTPASAALGRATS